MMPIDDAERTLLGMLAEAATRNAPRLPAGAFLGGLLPQLSLRNETSGGIGIGEQLIRNLSAAADAEAPANRALSEIGRGLTENATQLARQLAELATSARAQMDSVEENTQAVIQNSLAKASGDTGTTARTIGRTVATFLGSGLGLVRLFGKLFDGKSEELPPVLSSYSLPPPIHLEAGLTQTPPPSIQPIRYGQGGLPVAVPAAFVSQTPAITIQVQAIDSRSFMDHSSEIARAVKDALLNSHSLNDVVAEL